jgi:hypothetical protein
MAQIISTPGQNQTFANTVVVASQLTTQNNIGPGLVSAQNSQVYSPVPYSQSEPGATPSPNHPLRS